MSALQRVILHAMVRRKILFSLHHLQRLLVRPGFPKEAVPALHVCPDGLLFKDSFVSFDDVTGIDAPPELQLEDPSLAGQEAEISLAPGEGCLVLHQAGAKPRDVVFLVPEAASLRDRLLEVWSRHRHDVPDGWRRIRNDRFSLSCPLDWEPEESRHPHLQLRLFSKTAGVLMSLLSYEEDGRADVESVVSDLLANLKQGSAGVKLLSRDAARVGDLAGQRLVVEDKAAAPPVVSDTWILRGPGRVLELQFLVPADRYPRSRETVERVAASLRLP